MSEPKARRFPFWLTLSVLGNLVLLGLLAGIFLNAPPRFEHDRGRSGDRPRIELTDAERDEVRQLMRESFEAGREAMGVRRDAERELAEILRTEVYDDAAAHAALAKLREADRVARDTVGDHMFDGLSELSPNQRALVSKIMSGNLEKRGKRGEKVEKFKERRENAKTNGPEEAPEDR